ncbi:hypothetical protein ACLOJK_022092 [Asimina triloba]
MHGSEAKGGRAKGNVVPDKEIERMSEDNERSVSYTIHPWRQSKVLSSEMNEIGEEAK